LVRWVWEVLLSQTPLAQVIVQKAVLVMLKKKIKKLLKKNAPIIILFNVLAPTQLQSMNSLTFPRKTTGHGLALTMDYLHIL